jgi:hypothetical protein
MVGAFVAGRFVVTVITGERSLLPGAERREERQNIQRCLAPLNAVLCESQLLSVVNYGTVHFQHSGR